MPYPFNKALDLKLLELVKANECLYNTSHDKYSNLDMREVVWQKIGDALSRPAQMCKSRWVNIRDMMRKKLRERIRNPNQHSYHYRYEEQLAFMLPHFKETALPPLADNNEFDETCDIDETFINQQNCENEQPSNKLTDTRDVLSIITERTNINHNHQNLDTATPPDSLEVFLLTIGSTLRKFSPYYLNQAKSKIFQVVQAYELEQICQKDSRFNLADGNR